MTWRCGGCGSSYSARPATCGICLSSKRLRREPSSPSASAITIRSSSRRGVISASKLHGPSKVRLAYSGPLEAWGLPMRHSLALVGPPGGGKSTLAAMAATGWQGRSALIISAEEPSGEHLRARLVRVGADLTKIAVSDAVTMDELVEDVGSSVADLVVIDSVSVLAATPAKLVEVLAGRSWVCVIQLNARGGSLGGHGWEHAADCVVSVNGGRAVPSKNRAGFLDEIRVF